MTTPPKINTYAKPPGRPALPPGSKTPPPASPKVAHIAKTFKVEEWGGEGEGEKIVIYGDSGMGKSTLASTSPKPAFIGLDDGGRKLRHPKTGAVLHGIPGVRTFQDLRDALAQTTLFDDYETVVIDTITKVEELSEPWMFANYKTDKGATVKSIEGYGWGKGYRHSLEIMRLIFQDCDVLVRRGLNVILLAQSAPAVIANAEGLDYLMDGPKLHHTKQCSTRLEIQEWADHVLRVGYLDTTVEGADKATRGKIVSSDTTRAIFTQAARHYFAKSRTLREPVISFSEPGDDSLWQWMFPPAQ